VRVYDEATRRVKLTMSQGNFHENPGHSNRVFAVCFIPNDNNMLLTGGWDNTIQVWDLRKGTSIRSLYGAYLCGDALRVTADGLSAVTGSWRSEKNLQVWDIHSGKLTENVTWQSAGQPDDHRSSLFNVDLSNDADSRWILAAGSGEHELKLFDRNGSKTEAVVSVLCPSPLFSAAFHPNDNAVACGGADGRVRVYDLFLK
jgi:WD40 repeat protein